MPADRYMKIVLTVIALELGWIAVKDAAVEVSAQQQATAMPVIIRGVEATPGKPGSIPVTITGSTTTVRVASERPFQVDVTQPLKIQADQPIVVESGQRPLLVQSVPASPAARPGP